MQQESNDHYWRLIPSFDSHSRLSYSSVSGQVKRDGDVGVIRPIRGLIDQEGFFDITIYDAEQLAQMLGWISPAEAAALRSEIDAKEAALEAERKAVWTAVFNALKGARARTGKADA